jgi:hypothetical protein
VRRWARRSAIVATALGGLVAGVAVTPLPVLAQLQPFVGEWQGYMRGPDGTDVPFRLVIAETGLFEGFADAPVNSRYSGLFNPSGAMMLYGSPPGSGALSISEEGGKRALVGEIKLFQGPFRLIRYEVRLEARAPATTASPPRPAPPRAETSSGSAAEGPAIAVEFRYPPANARLADSITSVVADVTSSHGLASVQVIVNGTVVRDVPGRGARALPLDASILLREGENVIVVRVTDVRGRPYQDVRTVVHEPAGRLKIVYRIRGSPRRADVTYRGPDGGMRQEQADLVADTAWERTVPGRPGDTVEVTARGAEPGTVTCEIVVDGRTVAERSGRDGPVTCRGVVTAP